MKVFKIKLENFPKAIKRAIKFLKEGKVIVGPSDTVYGIYCDPENEKAVKKIFEIKKRPREKPIAVFVKDIKMAKSLARVSQKIEKFLKKVWPGPVTVILKSKREIPFITHKKTIGLRMPKDKFLLALLRTLKKPIAQTSANISGKPATNKIQKVINYFKNQKIKPDLILDNGDLKSSKPSKVIDLTGKKPKVRRP